MNAEDITPKCLETSAILIKYQKRNDNRTAMIPLPWPKKTIVIIAAGPLNKENGVCGMRGDRSGYQFPDLKSGQSVIISGDVPHFFSKFRDGGGVGIFLLLKHQYLGTGESTNSTGIITTVE